MATRRGTKGSADFDFFQAYTKDLTSEDVQRLFTRDARDAYQFFTRHIDEKAFQGLPPIRRLALRTRLVTGYRGDGSGGGTRVWETVGWGARRSSTSTSDASSWRC